MKLDRIIVALPLALFGSACGVQHDETSLNHYSEEMTQSLDAVEASATSHHTHVLDATDPSAVGELEQAYVREMNTRMGAMENAQESIERCADEQDSTTHDDGWQAMHDGNDAMGAAMGDTTAEIQRHTRAMKAAPDLASKLSEERIHRTNIDRLIDGMRTHESHMTQAMMTMEEASASMMCSMDSHMHR